MTQIVNNLLANAVKFTNDGGHVTLQVRHVARIGEGEVDGAWCQRRFPVATTTPAAYLEVRVMDTGIGMSRAGLAQIFTPFIQLDSRLGRQFEGTGLGLAMVKRLAELHGGTVAVESAVGEGSRFSVWLPCQAAEGTSQRPADGPEGDLHPRRSNDVALVR